MADFKSTLPVTDSSDGATGSAIPTQATMVGGTDGTNLRAVKVSSTGVVSVDGSAVIQPVVLPSNYSIPTRFELSQYVALGQAFCVSNNTLVANTATTQLIYITNPNGSGKTFYLAVAFLSADITKPNWIQYNFFISPTISANGSALTISNLLPGSGTSSVVSAFSGPTVTSAGTLVEIYDYGSNNSAPNQTVSSYDLLPYVILPPNTKLLLNATAKANSTTVNIILKWFEV